MKLHHESLDKARQGNKISKRKRELLIERENKFQTRLQSKNFGESYNALTDQHAFHYFLNKPVKKHLKKLSKVFDLLTRTQAMTMLPSTHQNLKTIETINQYFSENSLTLEGDPRQINKERRSKSNYTLSNQKGFNQSYFHEGQKLNYILDPYMSSIQPSPFYRTNKIKLQILKRRQKAIRDQLKDKSKKLNDKNVNQANHKQHSIQKGSYRIKGVNNKFQQKNKHPTLVKNQEFKKFLSEKKRQVSERQIYTFDDDQK